MILLAWVWSHVIWVLRPRWAEASRAGLVQKPGPEVLNGGSGRIGDVKSVPGPAGWFLGGGRICALVSGGGAARRVGPSELLLSLPENNTGLNKLASSGAGNLLNSFIF